MIAPLAGPPRPRYEGSMGSLRWIRAGTLRR